jgi:hypothetical protein
MVPIVVLPVSLGAAWSLLAFSLLSLLCFREFAGATGFFREKLMSLLVVVGILALTFAAADHWYRLFVALTPIFIVVITAVATSLDRPKGYIQRVALAIFGFILFGTCLGHLAYMTNDTHYRSLVLLLIFSIQLNDVFVYIVGKSFGGPKLAPETSPNKTISGSLGALVLTTLLVRDPLPPEWGVPRVSSRGPVAPPKENPAEDWPTPRIRLGVERPRRLGRSGTPNPRRGQAAGQCPAGRNGNRVVTAGSEMHIEGKTTTTHAGATKSREISAGDREMTRQTRIPLAVKLAYTMFVAILVDRKLSLLVRGLSTFLACSPVIVPCRNSRSMGLT